MYNTVYCSLFEGECNDGKENMTIELLLFFFFRALQVRARGIASGDDVGLSTCLLAAGLFTQLPRF